MGREHLDCVENPVPFLPLVRALLAKPAAPFFVGQRVTAVVPLRHRRAEPAGVREGRVGGGVQLRERRHDHAAGDRRRQAFRWAKGHLTMTTGILAHIFGNGCDSMLLGCS